MSRAIATVGFGPMRPVLDLALESFRPYAERHGYDLVIGSGDAGGRPPAWAKVVLARRLLDSYESVLWLDSDLVIVDGGRDLAEDVPAGAFQAMVEWDGPDGERAPNTGVWFLRSTDTARAFLRAVWDADRYVHGTGMWENMAVIDLLGYSTARPYHRVAQSPWREGTWFLPAAWNARTRSGQPGVRIEHYSAMQHEQRVRQMALANLRAELPASSGMRRLRVGAEIAARRVEAEVYRRRRAHRDHRRYFDERLQAPT